MRSLLFRMFILVIALMSATASLATTWRVEQDGSGDFFDIQPAVNASSPGDTIFIGSGNYSQGHSIEIPEWPAPTDAFVYLTTERLTLIGAGPDLVFIGPDEYYETFYGPIGICGAGLQQSWQVEGVSLRNLREGVYAEGGASFKNCRFENNRNAGIQSFAIGGISVENCRFSNNLGGGIISSSPTTSARVLNSEFEGNISSFFQDTENVLVESCNFSEITGGIQFDNSSGSVRRCTFRSMSNYGLAIISNSNVVVDGCDIQVPGDSIRAAQGSTVEIAGSILAGGTRNVWIRSGSFVTAHGNHILKPGLFFVKCERYVYPPDPPVLDFTNNYWGTTDLDSIAAGIWDNHDDGNQPVVQFEPISDIPLPVEGQEKSFGGFKAMFR